MHDPFFDEDDGEFDDLYGSTAAAEGSASAKQQRGKERSASPQVQGRKLHAPSPAASSSAVSRSYGRERQSSMASTSTNVTLSGTSKKRSGGRSRTRRKNSQDLFEVEWASDAGMAQCGLCQSDFSLVRRKHHCRHCGRVMCADCSSFLFFEFSQRKHRVCAPCNNQLLSAQEDFEHDASQASSAQNEHFQHVNRRDTSRLFEDSDESDRDRPSAVAMTPSSTASDDARGNKLRSTIANVLTPKPREDEESELKAKKKLEKKERKEKRRKERQARKKQLKPKAKSEAPAPTSSANAEGASQAQTNASATSTALFSAADDTWFTDVPGKSASDPGSDDDYSVEDGAGYSNRPKGAGWRDQVKKSYTVTAATAMTVKPSGGLLGDGPHFSNQFKYDDVSGPGLGHEDDFSEAMPRPKVPQGMLRESEQSGRPSQKRSGLGDASDSEKEASEDDFRPRNTLKNNLKDLFHTSKARAPSSDKRGKKKNVKTSKKEKMAKNSKPHPSGDKGMTLDELEPSDMLEDEPRQAASLGMPRPMVLTSSAPTFYDDDANKLVVDDALGYFEESISQQAVHKKREEQQQQQLASELAWATHSALPPTVRPRRFSSEQESYSLVDAPSHGASSPDNVESKPAPASTSAPQGNGDGKGGITGALKRFFGMGAKTPPKAKQSSPPNKVATKTTNKPPSGKDRGEISSSPKIASSRGQGFDADPPLDDAYASRHTAVDYYGSTRGAEEPIENFRHTMAASYLDPWSMSTQVDSSGLPQPSEPTSYGTSEARQRTRKSQRSKKRRDTFDDLFESPKNDSSTSGGNGDDGRPTMPDGGGWAARPGFERPTFAVPVAGVSRFDDVRRDDEDDDFGSGSSRERSAQPNKSGGDWGRKSAMSVREAYSRPSDREDGAPLQGSTFSWNNVQSMPGVGTATYAVPTSLRPHAAHDDARDSSFRYSQQYTDFGDRDVAAQSSRPLGGIMDELKRGPSPKEARGKESVDDFFAEFDEPNDYVFDPSTGGYVAARAPPRAAPARAATRSESRDFRSVEADEPREKKQPRHRDQDFYAQRELVPTSTTLTVVPKEETDGEVEDEVAEIIVGKISSLEGELAALKLLIRNRKGNETHSRGSPARGAKSNRHGALRASVRKESIFDNDSSEEDERPTRPVRLPTAKREGKRRPGSKKKRKDSFAGLFDDSPDEKETLVGATSYEALFQNGVNVSAGSEKEDSDEEHGFSAKLSKKTASSSKRRSSRASITRVTKDSESENEPEYASLKNRRGKKSIARKRSERSTEHATDVGFDSMESESKASAPMPTAEVATKNSTKKKPAKKDEDDPIDALFDTSKERDMDNLFGGNHNDSGDEDTLPSRVLKQPSASRTKSVLASQASSTSLNGDDESEGESLFSGSAHTDYVGRASVAGNSKLLSPGSEATDEVAEDEEEFSVNWAKVRSGKAQRRGTLQSSTSSVSDADAKSEDSLPEPTGLVSSLEMADTRTDRSNSDDDAKDNAENENAFVAATSSNWMAITDASEGFGAMQSADSDEDEDLGNATLPSSEASTAVDTSKAEIDDSEAEDGQSAPISTATVDGWPMGKEAEKQEKIDSTSSLAPGSDNTPDVRSSTPSVSSTAVVKSAEPLMDKDDAHVDIFDKSKDVDFMSLDSHLQSPTIVENDDESDALESSNGKEEASDEEEAFSFEIRLKKKRPSAVALPIVVPSTPSASERSESSAPSPSSSTDDDHVAFGKYATSSVASSRPSSIDDSLDGLEESTSTTAATESSTEAPLLGPVEAEAFDSDWQQMQAKEKERKKRLQLKQRQAQREKVLRKQGSSSKASSSNSAANSSSKSKSKGDKKKKKVKDDSTKSSHHKKSSKKHQHREKDDGDDTAPANATSEPPRTLTEL